MNSDFLLMAHAHGTCDTFVLPTFVLSYALYMHFSHSNFSETRNIQSPEEVKGHSIMFISCYSRYNV